MNYIFHPIYRRFIPTGVGNPTAESVLYALDTVHPHGCGESFHNPSRLWCLHGSSPRVWGIHGHNGLSSDGKRFIPTGVGNPQLFPLYVPSNTVHPHGCGESTITLTEGEGIYGSSPRVWGILSLSKHFQWITRFIPTGVGNPDCLLLQPLAAAVHPHGCGESMTTEDRVKKVIGSSPRVWGIQLAAEMNAEYKRFIPTGVGNPS